MAMLPLVDHDGLCAVTGLRRGLADPSKGFGSDEIDNYPDEFITLLPSSSQAAPASSPWTIEGVEPEAGTRLGFQLVSIVGRFPDISEEDLDLVQISFGDKRQRPLRYSPSRILCHSIPVPQSVPHLTISVSFDGGFSFTDQDALFAYNDASIIHVGQTGSHVMHWGMAADVVNLREEADVELYYAAQAARPQVSEPPHSRLRRRITAAAQRISKRSSSTTSAGEDAAKKSSKLLSRRGRKSISENTRAPLAQVAHSGRASWVETKYPGFMSRQQIAIDAFQREDLRVSITSRRTREALLAKHGNGFAALDTLVDSFASYRPGPGVDGDATNAPSNNSMDRNEIDSSASNMAESIATNMASILPNLTPEQGNALSATKAQLAALQVQGMPVRSIACSEAGAIILLEDGRLLAPVYRSKPLPGQKVEPDDPPPEMLMEGWLTLDTVSSVAQKTEELASDPVEEVDQGPDASGEVSGKRGLGWLGTLRNRHSPRTGKNDHSPSTPRSPASPRDTETATATEPRGRTRLRLHQTTAAFRFLNSADPVRGSGAAISAAQSSETAGVEVVMIPPEHGALDAETPENQDEHPFRANPASVFTTDDVNPQGDEDGTNVPAWFFDQRTDAIDAARIECLRDMVFPRYQQVVRVAAGANHFCAITDDLNGAQLYTWGSNSHGQLGLGADVGDFVFTPKLVTVGDVSNGAARSQVRRLACGANTSICACLDDKGQSALYAWGATGFETSNFVRRVLRGSAKPFRNEDAVLEATFPHSMKHMDHCKALYASESSHSGMLASAQATSFLPIKCLDFRPTRREENSRAARSPADQNLDSAATGEDARRDSADAETFWNTRLDRWLLAVEDEAAVARSNIPYYVETDEASEELARQNKLGEVLDMHVQMYQTYIQDVERAMDLGAAQAETSSAEDVVWIKLRGLLRTVEEAKSDLDRRVEEVTQRQLVLRALARTNMLNKGTTLKAYRHANGEVTRQRFKESLRWTEQRGEKLTAEIAALDEQAELLLEQQETLQEQEEILVDLMDDWQRPSLPVSNSSSQALSDDLDTLLQLASDLQACQIANLVRHGSLGATANSSVGLTTGAGTVSPSLGRRLSRASARAQAQPGPQQSLEGALFAKTNRERIFASPEQLVSESSLTAALTDAFEGECLGLSSATHALHRKLSELYESSASFLKGDPVSRQLADMVCDLAEQKQLRNCALQAMLSESERGTGSHCQSAQTPSRNGVAATVTVKPQDIQAPMRVCNVESPFVDYNNIQ